MDVERIADPNPREQVYPDNCGRRWTAMILLRICECRSRRFWVDCRQDRCRRFWVTRYGSGRLRVPFF